MSPSAYKQSGVDIDAGEDLVDRIKSAAKSTRRVEALSDLGGFAGFFSLANTKLKSPVLVATTDGVGTKLKLALETGLIDGLGQDLVAMCVNDLLCTGAEPLFFLDYFATGALNVDQAARVIEGIAASLKDINCTLLGGETAEMPGLYAKGDFDLAGFAVGIVDRDSIIDGSPVGIGNRVIGLRSSGFHSNGYSLVRHIIAKKKINLEASGVSRKTTLAEELLAPTKIYVNPVQHIIKNFAVHSLAHITGGGLTDNLPRVLPKKCKAVLQKSLIKTPLIFRYFQDQGGIDEAEMWRVFNMGIGMTMIVHEKDKTAVLEQLNAMGCEAISIGVIEERLNPDEDAVVIV